MKGAAHAPEPSDNDSDRPVVVTIMAGTLRLPVRGHLVSETPGTVHLRIAEGWEVDILRSMILSVQDDA